MRASRLVINMPSLILIIILAAGCATSNIAKESRINDRDGVLITKVHSNAKMLKVFVSDEDGKSYVAELFPPEDAVKVISVKSGKGCFGRLVRYGLVFNYYHGLKPHYFNIEPGAITYVGDVYVNWIGTDIIGGGSAQVHIIDNEDETVGQARKEYPWLFERFQYRKNLPLFDTSPKPLETNDIDDIRDLFDEIIF